MLNIGQYQVLTFSRAEKQGLYLQDNEGNEILMPKYFATADMRIGEQCRAFIYCDSHNRPIATTETPFLTVGGFATLVVAAVNTTGVFCEWGVSKDLFIPFRNLRERDVEPDDELVVHMYLDEVSNRLVGTTKLRQYLQHEFDSHITVGQEVDLIIYDETELGYKAIIQQHYTGLLYNSEIHIPLYIGQQVKGYVKPERDDHKIDLSLYPIGHNAIEASAQKILQMLNQHNGFLPFTDSSSPADIRDQFGISKKLFKKAIGSLYKQHSILIQKDGIRTVTQNR